LRGCARRRWLRRRSWTALI